VIGVFRLIIFFGRFIPSTQFHCSTHFKHQITDFIIINNDKYTGEIDLLDYTKNVYEHIFTFLENLTHLTIIAPSDSRYPPLTLVGLPSTIFSSLILTKLSINVAIFDDCLFLLDGRLKQLSTFIVEVNMFSNVSFIGYNQVSFYFLF
jgi:hypothetical protein